jgi:hypothetical protein
MTHSLEPDRPNSKNMIMHLGMAMSNGCIPQDYSRRFLKILLQIKTLITSH